MKQNKLLYQKLQQRLKKKREKKIYTREITIGIVLLPLCTSAMQQARNKLTNKQTKNRFSLFQLILLKISSRVSPAAAETHTRPQLPAATAHCRHNPAVAALGLVLSAQAEEEIALAFPSAAAVKFAGDDAPVESAVLPLAVANNGGLMVVAAVNDDMLVENSVGLPAVVVSDDMLVGETALPGEAAARSIDKLGAGTPFLAAGEAAMNNSKLGEEMMQLAAEAVMSNSKLVEEMLRVVAEAVMNNSKLVEEMLRVVAEAEMEKAGCDNVEAKSSSAEAVEIQEHRLTAAVEVNCIDMSVTVAESS